MSSSKGAGCRVPSGVCRPAVERRHPRDSAWLQRLEVCGRAGELQQHRARVVWGGDAHADLQAFDEDVHAIGAAMQPARHVERFDELADDFGRAIARDDELDVADKVLAAAQRSGGFGPSDMR